MRFDAARNTCGPRGIPTRSIMVMMVDMAEPTFDSCLVPVDFEPVDGSLRDAISAGGEPKLEVSSATRRAVRLADRLAAGGLVHLVHATPQLSHTGLGRNSGGAWFPLDTARSLDAEAKETAMAFLEPLAGTCRHVRVTYEVRPGRPSDVILRVAAAVGAAAIVMPASGHGAIKRTVLGSTADKVIRQASCPVVVVPS